MSTTPWNPFTAPKVWLAKITTDCRCGYYNESHYTKENFDRLEKSGGLDRPCPVCGNDVERRREIVKGMKLS